MALKDGAAPPAHLLATRKSATLQALEVTSRASSAYEGLGSDSEEDFDWSMALGELCLQPQSSNHGPLAASPSPAASPNPEAMGSDSESSAGCSQDSRHGARPSWPPRKAPWNPAAERVHLQGELDVNFNLQAAGGNTSDSSEPEEAPHEMDQQARRWHRACLDPKEQCTPDSHAVHPHVHQVRYRVFPGRGCPMRAWEAGCGVQFRSPPGPGLAAQCPGQVSGPWSQV